MVFCNDIEKSSGAPPTPAGEGLDDGWPGHRGGQAAAEEEEDQHLVESSLLSSLVVSSLVLYSLVVSSLVVSSLGYRLD